MLNFRQYINSYSFETELPGSGEIVTFKPICTRMIKKLLLYETSEDPNSIENALDEIISECVTDETFDIDELFLQDRFALLLDMRKATKGNLYTFSSTCTKCQSQTSQNVKLSDLKVKRLNIPKEIESPVPIKKKKGQVAMKKGSKLIDISEGEEIESMEDFYNSRQNWNLIRLNDVLSIRVLPTTRGEQKFITNLIASKEGISETQKMIEETTMSYAFSIKSIITPDGIQDDVLFDDKMYLVENIPQNEYMMIVKWFEDNDFGVDFSFEVSCAHCEHKETKNIPLDNFFF